MDHAAKVMKSIPTEMDRWRGRESQSDRRQGKTRLWGRRGTEGGGDGCESTPPSNAVTIVPGTLLLAPRLRPPGELLP